MRLNAIAAATVVVATLVGVGSSAAFADTNAGSNNKPAPHYVTVQQGDNLSAIAAVNSSTFVRIFDANQNIQDPNLIFPGEQVRIPDPSEQLPNRPLPNEQPAIVATNSPAAVQPAPAVTPVAPAPVVSASGSGIWYSLADCESGGNWAADTGNGFYGGLQFTLSSWQAAGGSGYPNQASPSEQIMRAQILQTSQGWGAWPVCSAKLGL